MLSRATAPTSGLRRATLPRQMAAMRKSATMFWAAKALALFRASPTTAEPATTTKLMTAMTRMTPRSRLLTNTHRAAAKEPRMATCVRHRSSGQNQLSTRKARTGRALQKMRQSMVRRTLRSPRSRRVISGRPGAGRAASRPASVRSPAGCAAMPSSIRHRAATLREGRIIVAGGTGPWAHWKACACWT